MIKIEDKSHCCGCESCFHRCPVQCISMNEDQEGFLYPVFDEQKCVNCGLCDKVCPVINQSKAREPLAVCAYQNDDENVRNESSSGGVFTFLAEQIIDKGGVVFGAKWSKDWEVVHDYAETKEALREFRGSKYVQSKLGNTFLQAEQFLKQERLVLFSGTPCQIAALKLFLRKDYSNLVTVDFICHGVPSPGVFRQYMQEQLNIYEGGEKVTCLPNKLIVPHGIEINRIAFRDKALGWKRFSMSYELNRVCPDGCDVICYSKPLSEDPFLRGFLRNLYLRPSCHECPTKELKSGSDFTIGDFWDIRKFRRNLDDDKGLSALLVNNERFRWMIDGIQIDEIPYSFLRKVNPAVVKSCIIPKQRALFWNDNKNGFSEKIAIICKLTIFGRIKRLIKSAIRK